MFTSYGILNCSLREHFVRRLEARFADSESNRGLGSDARPLALRRRPGGPVLVRFIRVPIRPSIRIERRISGTKSDEHVFVCDCFSIRTAKIVSS